MKAVTYVFVVTLTMIALTSSMAIAQAPVDNRPIIVLRQDDCRANWRTHYAGLGGASGLEYGKQKHIPITWAVITSQTNASNGTTGPLTWAELADYIQTAGGELASHSVTHTQMSSVDAYVSELAPSKAAIEHNVPGSTCKTFIQPGTWGQSPDSADTLHAFMDRFSELDNPIGQAIQANYDQSMGYLAGGWSVGAQYYKYGMARTIQIDHQCYVSIPALQAALDIVADCPGLVCVIMCHGIQETGGTADYEVSADLMKACMDRLAALRDAGTVRLMTFNDAHHTVFSDNLNCIPDPGFEHTNLSTSPIPLWTSQGGATVSPNGGRNGSRCAAICSGGQMNCSAIMLAPGRYELSWYQKQDVGVPGGKPLQVRLMDREPGGQWDPAIAMNYASFYNSAPGVWEKMSAYVLVRDRAPNCGANWYAAGSTSYNVDDVCLVKAPVNPAVSVSNFHAAPNPTQVMLTWLTPPDPDVSKLRVCYGKQTHPTSPTEGIFLADVHAVAGTQQGVSVPVDWTKQNLMYFSIFAMKPDGSYSPPDLALVTVDTTPPPSPSANVLMLSGSSADASWEEPPPGAFQYSYSVGTDPGQDNVVNWTNTQQTKVTLNNLPTRTRLYLSVRAQNTFGFWSSMTVVPFPTVASIPLALGSQDGASATISGKISAIFADCYYVQDSLTLRGMKVLGPASGALGDDVSVDGTVTTVNGERCIQP